MIRRGQWWWSLAERSGPWLAGLCAVHCMVLPVALALTASMTVSLLSWQHPYHDVAMLLLHLSRWEILWVGLALVVTFASLLLGFRRHRHWVSGVWFVASVAAFALAFTYTSAWMHAALMTVGSLLLIVATVLDRRLRPRQ